MPGLPAERSTGADIPNTRSQTSKQGPVKSDRFQPQWSMETFSGDLRWQLPMQWLISEEETVERVQENSNLVLTCNVCPKTSVNFTQMAFLALKNWINTNEWSSESSKGFLWGKKKIDCFLKIKHSDLQCYFFQMSLITTLNIFVSDLQQFQYVFPQIFVYPKNPLFVTWKKINSPQILKGHWYLLQILLSNGIPFWVSFNLNLFVLCGGNTDSYFHCLLYVSC